jgi:sugar phosphate isomerase/epimerase
MPSFKVGIDSYSLKPLGLSPFEVLDWAVMNGAEGVQFSEVNLGPGQALDKTFLDELRTYAAENSLYIEWGGGEHIPLDLATGRPKDIAATNRRAAEQARRLGVANIRSCSGGLMRWKKDGPSTEEFLRLMTKALQAEKTMFEELGVTLAIETHFEFTTFELVRLFEMCEASPGGYLGVCLDTMNLLTMLEDPVRATERILPWVVTTHIKDGGLLLGADGFRSFTAEAGTGVVDLEAIITRLGTSRRRPNLSLEDHGGDFAIPLFDPEFRAGFPDLTMPELIDLLRLSLRTRTLVEARKLAVLDRARWPQVCEKRVKRGLRAVKQIVRGLTD